jgi:hypothetical protein
MLIYNKQLLLDMHVMNIKVPRDSYLLAPERIRVLVVISVDVRIQNECTKLTVAAVVCRCTAGMTARL